MMTLPSVTWPSPPIATPLPRRTERMVVPWKTVSFMDDAGGRKEGRCCRNTPDTPQVRALGREFNRIINRASGRALRRRRLRCLRSRRAFEAEDDRHQHPRLHRLLTLPRGHEA